MSQDSVREDQFEENFREFVGRARPARSTDEDSVEQIKGDMLGKKAPLIFTCQSCSETQVATEESYLVQEGTIVGSMRRQALRSIIRKLRMYLWNVPYVGTALRYVLPSEHTAVRHVSDRGIRKATLAAFEEVKDKFNQCENCGQYVCDKCFRNGKCADCRDGDG